MPDTYPARPPFFAHRYCRLLTKTCAANEIGHVAFTLCVTIAHLEDSKRYTGPVSFYNEQLIPLIGVRKWESLDWARRRAAEAGWLHYEPGNRGLRQPGRYWTTIPAGFDALDDTPCDESQYPEDGEWPESQYPQNGDWKESQYPAKGDQRGAQRGDQQGEHSIPVPNPICNGASDDASVPPKKSKRQISRFIPPTIEEVKAYCLDRKNLVDSQAFLDHYESNGWKVGKNPMKDWRAAVRNWERNRFGGGNGQQTTHDDPPRRVFR